MSSSRTPARRQATTTSRRDCLLTLLMALTLIVFSLASPLPIEGAIKASNNNDDVSQPQAQARAQVRQFEAPVQEQEAEPTTTAAAVSATTFGDTTNTNTDDPLLPERKYFHEPGWTEELSHYDTRFFTSPVPYDPHLVHLRHLIRSYLLMTSSRSLTTWLAHGTLLGWYWNGAIMPWDYDLDVQVSNITLGEMAREWNGTTFDYVYTLSEQEEKDGLGKPGEVHVKKYLLDVNPYWAQRTRLEGMNVIDARWIDMENGMYVDITGLSEDREGTGTRQGVWSDKNYHGYGTRQIWPLRKTEFEGVAAWVPWDVEGVLKEEYGGKSLTEESWAGHHFDHGRKEWVKTELVKKTS